MPEILQWSTVDGGAMSRVGKAIGTALAVVVGGAGVGAVWFAVAAQPKASGATSTPVPMQLATVTRGTVAERALVSGTLGFDGSYSIVHQGQPGLLTAVAAADTTVHRGGQLYTVAAQPIRLLYGSTPAYRDLAVGMPDGPDVRQLEENLVGLGMDPHHQITVDRHFTAATGAAVRRWQAAWGLSASQRTGRLPLGGVVFQPSALRISQATATVGTQVRPNEPILSATSATPVVTAQISADRRRLVHVGDQVSISMTGVQPFPGTVVRVARVAAAPSQQSGPAPTGTSPQSTVQVTIKATVPAGGQDLEEAPVQVAITRETHQNVLLVPVTALLARPGGGYQVRLESGQYVLVEPGLFDSVSGTVEVTGALSAGQKVKVPAS
jgi:peptidoglycan hydrolase-like protein with peptidoglycan-binding domain